MSKSIAVTCKAHSTLPLGDLVEFQGELKTLTQKNLEKLKRSILKNGFTAPIFVWDSPSGEKKILDGHQRLKALKSLQRSGYTIPELPVVYIDAETEPVAKEKLLLITSQYGDFQLEGFQEFVLDLNSDLADIRLTINEFKFRDDDEPEESPYTNKIQSPVYEPKMDSPPSFADMFDTSKKDELVQEIIEADIDDDLREFLISAACRHTVFNYQNIAEYYAHAPANVQRLMEKSALVIIDFQQAIELGFVRLTKDLWSISAAAEDEVDVE